MPTLEAALIRRLAIVLVGFACFPRASAADSAPEAHLELKTHTDRQVYLPGEPVLMGMSVRNIGSGAFADLAPFGPRHHFLAISVTRNGTSHAWTAGYETWVYASEGPSLGQGAELCDVFDLGDYFGTSVQFSRNGKQYSFRRA